MDFFCFVPDLKNVGIVPSICRVVYGFLWMPGEEPIMFGGRKSVTRPRVKDHIPYLATKTREYDPPLGKLTESALGVLDHPKNHAEDLSGGLTSSPDRHQVRHRRRRPVRKREVLLTRGTKVEVATKMRLKLMSKLGGV